MVVDKKQNKKIQILFSTFFSVIRSVSALEAY